MSTRFAPALSLFVLTPLVAEYLLGSLPMSMITILPIMAAMYGSAAVLIREIARRIGGGWGTIALLGLAYGLIEEGLVDQSLFNPDYLHLRLLDYGYVPALGTGLPWLIYVLTIHVVWSICVPIGLAEALFPARRTEKWLGAAGLAGFSLLFLAGAAAIAGFTYTSAPFMASPGQLIGAAVAVVAAIAAAFASPRYRPDTGERRGPAAWLLFVVAFLAGSGVMMCRYFGPYWHWPWPLCVAVMLAIEAGFVIFMIGATRDRRWSDFQRFALVAGGLAVYALFGVFTDRALHGAADFVPHTMIILFFVVVAAIAVQRLRSAEAAKSRE
jgi:hypothetical protein